MNENKLPLDHLEALLADRALQGADPAEQAGINCLLKQKPTQNSDALDLTAAALDMALSSNQHEPLPAHLLSKLQSQGEAIVGENKSRKVVEPVRMEQAPTPQPALGSKKSLIQWAGWAVAAGVLIYIMLPKPGSVKSHELAYQEMKDRGVVSYPGTTGPKAEGPVSGEIVWDDKTQTGYMKLQGLPVNDPAKSQFQLWIFDDRKFTEKTPVDGGVFDVKRNGEVIIPIKANIKVSKPSLFAITKEQPGGVMVSDRDKIVFVAKPKS
ncbi:MAG TPA: anti-sigma factor [Gemmatales bacterium]|nr:anti-sigma factor [Gemmatales bacterium]